MDETPHAGEQMPSTIGRYQVQDSIGFGAMGAVYKAFDPLIKRTLAIKTIRLDIPKQSPQYKSFIERFYHEARISGTLSHPNIVTLFDIGEEGGLPYLAMEFVEGETIASILERGLRFNPEKVIGLVSQVASAIDYAHTKGVIHRDIKPSNLILYDNDRVKVTDFGIAKLVDAEMTQSGTLLGTPSYMSPEQAMGDKLDGRSDIFSLGVCAFEMLCGEQPFPGNNVTSILYKLVHVDPIEPANLEMNGLVPEKWHEVFGRVLAKKPDERYQTATEFVQDLEYCLGAWFGAMGDETAKLAAAPAAEPERPGDEITAALPAVTDVPPAARKTHPPEARPTAATTRMPPSGPPAARKTGPMPAPPRRSGPGTSPGSAAPAARPPAARAAEPEPDDAATVMLKGPAGPPSRRPSAPAAPAAEAEAATILMRGTPPPPVPGARPARPAAPSEPEGATIVMKGGSAPVSAAPTIRQAAPAVDRTPTPPPVVPPFPEPGPTAIAPAPGMVAPRRSMLTLAMAGIGVLLLLVVLATAGLILLKRPTPAASPSPVAAARPSRGQPATPTSTLPAVTSGTVHVESTPAGATVTVDGQAIGKTPLDTPALALGTHEVKLDLDGYASTTDSVQLTAESPSTEVKQALSRTVPATGLADVISTPPGATVKIDGTSVGTTPLRGQKLNVGRHRVEVSADGYDLFSGSVTVREGRTARLDAGLHAIPAPSPVRPSPTPHVAAADDHVYDENDSAIQPKPIKVGGKSAEYPKDAPALKRGQRSSVTVSFVVLDTGEVSDVQVVESAGSTVDEAVVGAFKTWRFTPGMKQGAKVRVRVTRRQTFLGG